MARVLALDFGEKRIGAALSDATTTIASPYGYVKVREDTEGTIDQVRQLCVEKEVNRIIVGLPLNMDGEEGGSAGRARAFGAALEANLGLPVEYVDESYTTAAAERLLINSGVSRRKRKGKVDSIAAAMILQTWLEGQTPQVFDA